MDPYRDQSPNPQPSRRGISRRSGASGMSGRESSLPARYCSVCGAANHGVAEFCARCGLVLDVSELSAIAPVHCRDCGNLVSPGDSFCTKCGASQPARQNQTRQVPAERPTPGPVMTPAPMVVGAPVVIQIGWYLLFGIWLSYFVVLLAWLATLTVIGIPLAEWLLKQIPLVLMLKSPSTVPLLTEGQRERRELALTDDAFSHYGPPQQIPFVARAVYFTTVGWWFSLLWLVIAWTLALLTLPMPVAVWMFEQLGAVTTLERD